MVVCDSDLVCAASLPVPWVPVSGRVSIPPSFDAPSGLLIVIGLLSRRP